MTVRLYALIIILGLAVIAATIGLAQKPLEPPMKIDAQSPGVWPRYADDPMGDAPANLLVSPCPLSPQNLPLLPSERKA